MTVNSEEEEDFLSDTHKGTSVSYSKTKQGTMATMLSLYSAALAGWKVGEWSEHQKHIVDERQVRPGLHVSDHQLDPGQSYLVALVGADEDMK